MNERGMTVAYWRKGQIRLRIATMAAVAVATGALGVVPAGAISSLALNCSGPTVSGAASASASAAAPASVPENGAALVNVSAGLPGGGNAGASVTAATVTFTIPQVVADVDLTFSGGNVAARDWDARGGERIVVLFEAPAGVPYGQAVLPVITIVNTFDPGSQGSTVSWPVYRSMAITTVGDAPGTTTCSTTAPGSTWATTAIAAPTQRHDTATPARDVPAPLRFSSAGTPVAPATPGAPAPGTPADPTGAAGNPPADGSAAPAPATPDPSATDSSTTVTGGGAAPGAAGTTTTVAGSATEHEVAAAPTLVAADKPVWMLVLALLLAAGIGGLLFWFARGERGLSS